MIKPMQPLCPFNELHYKTTSTQSHIYHNYMILFIYSHSMVPGGFDVTS